MERRVKISLARIVGAALLAFAFLVCSNPIDIVGTVTTEVKTANNKFLIIKGVGPSSNTTGVNPGVPLTIVFDRDVDPSNFISNIRISPTADFKTPTYIQATKTLSFEPDPFLNDNTLYTVTIKKGATSSDGSDLQNEYSWAFTTGEYPTASVQISDPASPAPGWAKLTLTNNDAHPSLWIKSNLAAAKFRLGRTESECLSAGWQSIPSTDWKLP
ncbi:MAG TPA: Ig-like domain-containing protein, partial [Spirochaetia bacterium]|nr:Ig-like domain-containing protein [Spirochaetia bacterium]